MVNEKEFYEKLGLKIREMREEKGFKPINALCSKLVDYGLDLSDSMFGKYELGSRHISVYRLALLAKSLDTTIDELIPKN